MSTAGILSPEATADNCSSSVSSTSWGDSSSRAWRLSLSHAELVIRVSEPSVLTGPYLSTNGCACSWSRGAAGFQLAPLCRGSCSPTICWLQRSLSTVLNPFTFQQAEGGSLLYRGCVYLASLRRHGGLIRSTRWDGNPIAKHEVNSWLT